jgi:hypothetical protein
LHIGLYFPLASLVSYRAGFYILKINFLFFPGIEEYYIRKDITTSRFAKNNLLLGLWYKKHIRIIGLGSRSILGQVYDLNIDRKKADFERLIVRRLYNNYCMRYPRDYIVTQADYLFA